MNKHEQGLDCRGCNEMLQEGHPDIVAFFRVFKEKYPDMHTSCVYRDRDAQNDAFIAGVSKLKFPKSKHNSTPSRAIDIFQIDPNGHGIFDPSFCRQIYKEMQELGLDLLWGGLFKHLGDFCHFQLQEEK